MAGVKVLINDSVKRYLLNAKEPERKQLRKSFEYLESGLWEGGLRIKRLQGIARTVLEARLNRGDRILFTLGHQTQPHGTLLYVWAIVAHDDVERTARGMDPDSAPFLSFASRETIESTDVDLEALDESCYTEESPEQPTLAKSGPQRWFVLDDAEWQRLLLYSKDDFEVFLFLTPEQKILLEKPPPLLVSGTAGSGKTTLSVYYLLRPALLERSCLFVTYNRHLRNFCERLYLGLLNQRPDRQRIRPPRFRTFKELCLEVLGNARSRFAPEREVDCFSFQHLIFKNKLADKFDAMLIWEEIRSIIKGAKPQISSSNLRMILREWTLVARDAHRTSDLREELLSLQRLSLREKADSALQRVTGCSLSECVRGLGKLLAERNTELFRALQTIAAQMEKHEADFSAPLMTLSEYEQIGRKRAPAFVHNRADVYSIAQWYQSRLESEQLWDEIDLTRAVIRSIDQRTAAAHSYDFVCCDEIQDLTDVQLSLLVRLPKSPEMMLLAGDPKQIINPSGFRWEEAKGLFYERGLTVPEVHSLTVNFRCVGNIVALSNVLLKIKQELLGVRSDEKADEWKFQGQPPFLIENVPRPELIESLRVTGADRIILTREGVERDRLKRELGTELVFTIEESKGLEFRSVVLWKFCREKGSEDLWTRILQADTAKVHEAAIRHEINLLYVAITRAQRNLIVYDGESSSVIWNDPRIEDLIFRTQSSDRLEQVWRAVSTPKEWKKQGDYYFENEHYRAAAECYRNAGLLPKAQRALALASEKRGQWAEAAVFWEQLGEMERAAVAYERGGEVGSALPIWELLGNTERALECRISILETEKKYPEAAELWEQAGRFDRAKEDWHLAKRPDRVAVLHERDGRLLDAAQCYKDCGRFDRAADLFEKAGRPEEAARCLESATHYREAAELWKRLGRDAEHLSSLQRLGDAQALGEFYEQRKNWGAALEWYVKVKNSEATRQRQEELAALPARNQASRALRLSLLDRSAEAAPLWEKARCFDLAAEQYQSANELHDAGRCFARAHRWSEAVEAFLRDKQLPMESHKAVERAVRAWIRARPQTGRGEIEALGERLRKEHLILEALIVFDLIHLFAKAAECAWMKHQQNLAFQYLAREKNVEAVARFCLDRNLYEEGVRMLYSRLHPQRPDRQQYYHFTALVEGWKNSSLTPEAMQALADIVNLHFTALPAPLVLSILETAARYDELLYVFNDTVTRLGGKRDVHQYLGAWATEAKIREAKGDMAGAGLRFLVLGETQHAHRCWSYVDPAITNLRCLEESGHQKRVLDFLWHKERYIHGGDMATAYRNYARAVEFYKKSKDPEHGARLLESEKQYREAMELYRQAGNLRKTATLLEKLNEFEEAAGVWQQAGDPRRRQLCLRKLGSRAVQQKLL